MTDRVAAGYRPHQQQSGDPLPPQTTRISVSQPDSATMNSREHSQMPPAPSYPSPNASQIAQGTMAYYPNQRQLTEDEINLGNELSREVGAPSVADSHANGMAHGQPMGLPASHPTAPETNRGPSEHHQQHQAQPQHPQQTQQQQQTQQHLMQFPPNQQVGMDPNHDLSYGDQSARRKRSKVSRACDECRRKKVRCDATSDNGVETCSNCRRTNATCEFSRVPMKRGPSKGYIKELADRINTLESQMQPGLAHQEVHYQPMHDDASPRGYHEFSPAVDNQLLPRKRTYSMSEGLPATFLHPAFQGPRPTSVGGWPVQMPGREAGADGVPGLDAYAGAMPANGAAKASQPFWSQESAFADQSKTDTLFEAVTIDEKILDAYHHHVHPILPILPVSLERLQFHLQRTDRYIQEVLLHSLLALTGASQLRAEKELQQVPTFEKAQDQLYISFREDPASRSLSANLILLHSTIFMALEADARGPENLRGHNGIPKSVLIEAAYSLAYYIARGLGQLKSSNPDDRDVDSDSNLARRNWISIMILSRFHAVSVAGPDYFGVYEASASDDKQILGLATLQLARYATVLSETTDLIFDLTSHAAASNGMVRALKRVMHGQLNRLRDVEVLRLEGSTDSASNAMNERLSPLIFWFITLLLKRHLCTFAPSEVLYAAEAIIDLLHKQSELPAPVCSPFHYHFLALAVITLLEITDIPELANDAWVNLDKGLQVITQREKHAATAGEFEKIFATENWEACIRAFVEVKLTKVRGGQFGAPQPATVAGGTAGATSVVGPTEQRSLQHLADLAVGAGGSAATNTSPPASAGNATGGEDKDAGSALPEALPQQDGKQQGQQRVFVDFSLLTKKGYLNVLAAH
ncbi:hypothetical protein VTO42DRAFT_8280 [Malbranchea cinnamomea]